MGKRIVGLGFCLIAAMLFSARYLAAAIFMSGVSSWSAEFFSVGLEYVKMPLLILSIISLAVGVAYLIWAEISDRKKSN